MLSSNSRCFAEVLRSCDRFAPTPYPVLILGETGVGKELLARRIHQLSGREPARFVAVNCGAIPASLIESELFGHEKGAFTGATQPHCGLVRQAHLGTLFLDEVGELEFSAQSKLLRLLELGECRPVGATRAIRANVRFIAATNVDLFAATKTKTFRADLLERLNVLTLQVPPLRERKEDIGVIAKSILDQIGSPVEQSLDWLGEYDWPGNVRQLKNFLTRVVVLGEGQVTTSLIRSLLRQERDRNMHPEPPFQGTLADIEKQAIVDRLRKCHGNRKKTAESLDISKSTLYEKLRQWKETAEDDGVVAPFERYPSQLGNALVERKAWIYDGISSDFLRTYPLHSRNQVGLGLASYEDSFVAQASGTIDLDVVEVALYGGGLAFLKQTTSGKFLASQLANENHYFGAEVGRFALVSNRYFGRLGAGLYYPVHGVAQIRLAINTGILASAEVPWSLHLGGSFFFPRNKSVDIAVPAEVATLEPTTLNLYLESKRIEGIFEIGGRLSWVSRSRSDAPLPSGVYERMLFSFGPVATLNASVGKINAAVLWRLWLDHEASPLRSPNEIHPLPDLSLNWLLSW